jgi:hypothetical protein
MLVSDGVALPQQKNIYNPLLERQKNEHFH